MLFRSQGNQELYLKLLRKFYNRYHDFEKEFNAARQEKDEKAPMRCAHTLKGVAANIGANGIREKADTLESACRNHQPEQEINQLLQDIVLALSQIMADLAPLAAPSPALAEDATPSADSDIPEKTVNIIKKLCLMIDESDIAALRIVAELQEMPGIEQYAEIMDAVTLALEDYDFDLAKKHMDALHLSMV